MRDTLYPLLLTKCTIFCNNKQGWPRLHYGWYIFQVILHCEIWIIYGWVWVYVGCGSIVCWGVWVGVPSLSSRSYMGSFSWFWWNLNDQYCGESMAFVCFGTRDNWYVEIFRFSRSCAGEYFGDHNAAVCWCIFAVWKLLWQCFSLPETFFVPGLWNHTRYKRPFQLIFCNMGLLASMSFRMLCFFTCWLLINFLVSLGIWLSLEWVPT